MPVRLSNLVRGLHAETAFTVLAMARALKEQGKDVVELEIGDSPFPSTPYAKEAGIRAIEDNQTGYCPSLGIPKLREAAARSLRQEFSIPVGPENIVVASGAKPFEQYFAEAFLDPGDGVLIYSPQFPTYVPNLARRGARAVLAPLRPERQFRPDPADIEAFLANDPQPRAVFLNSPHNPTGGVATLEDLTQIAEIARRGDLMVFSDEPYCHMIWSGQHHSILALPGMLEHAVAAYTFSKSYSMSGWRIGFAATSPEIVDAFGKLINTSASCSPPLVQHAAKAALERDGATRELYMSRFHEKVDRLCKGLSAIEGIKAPKPAGTFYVFPDVRSICNKLGITSHGLALYLLEGADPSFGVACLGGECFGEAGAGFLRFSCAEPDERIDQAVAFIPTALDRPQNIAAYKQKYPQFVLTKPYEGA